MPVIVSVIRTVKARSTVQWSVPIFALNCFTMLLLRAPWWWLVADGSATASRCGGVFGQNHWKVVKMPRYKMLSCSGDGGSGSGVCVWTSCHGLVTTDQDRPNEWNVINYRFN